MTQPRDTMRLMQERIETLEADLAEAKERGDTWSTHFHNVLVQRDALEADLAATRKALRTLGIEEAHHIEWLADGVRPGTVGWTKRVLDARAALAEGDA